MKNTTASMASILCLLAMICCNISFAQTSHREVTLTPLDNYFVKNTVPDTKGIHPTVINHQKTFDSYFGVAKTANNTIIKPDFSTQRVLLVLLPATENKTTVSIIKAEQTYGTLNVYFAVQKGEKMSYTIRPFALAAIKKDPSIKRIHFYSGSILFKTMKASS